MLVTVFCEKIANVKVGEIISPCVNMTGDRVSVLKNGFSMDEELLLIAKKVIFDSARMTLANGNKIINNVLDKKLDNTSGIENGRNSYLIYEGKIDKLSELTVKIGMWISYEDITNEYMNSGFVGTVKVYIESK